MYNQYMTPAKHRKWLLACDSLANIFSTCAKRKYCSIILAENERVCGFGYNGSPPQHAHCDEGHCPRFLQNSANGSNYDNCFANHAEANALLWSDISARQNGTLIINGPPCFGCCKLIASSGIRNVVMYIDKNYKEWETCADFLMTSNINIFYYVRDTAQPASSESSNAVNWEY